MDLCEQWLHPRTVLGVLLQNPFRIHQVFPTLMLRSHQVLRAL